MTCNTRTMKKQRWVTGEACTVTFSRHSREVKSSLCSEGCLFDCDRYDRFSSLRPTGNGNYSPAIYPITALQPDPKQNNLKCVEYSHFYPSKFYSHSMARPKPPQSNFEKMSKPLVPGWIPPFSAVTSGFTIPCENKSLFYIIFSWLDPKLLKIPLWRQSNFFLKSPLKKALG